MTANIHSLHIYPIKSCQGIDCEQVELTRTGFQYDRHWMLVDQQGQFLTQRQHPQMARIKPRITDNSLLISADDCVPLEIPLESPARQRLPVKIWNDQCSAALVSTAASEWFSAVLNHPCELVYLPDSEPRRVDPAYAHAQQTVGFADGFPLLIITQASAELLAQKLDEDIDINRFRANIVIDGCTAHAEDSWSAITLNNIQIDLVKPCSRCVIPSINQHTAESHPSLLKALAGYRRRDGKIYVGQNGLHQSTGTLHKGAVVTVHPK
ncbi:MAG: MOSC N-terminal beta barrel domain-containing protein [Gammaproteobacteria bacterium]|nr:MOSC N-terminal beta barrel domain-containing protein [Gammaproteobacteria bacterium]